jgi:hypothetical protein
MNKFLNQRIFAYLVNITLYIFYLIERDKKGGGRRDVKVNEAREKRIVAFYLMVHFIITRWRF